MKETETIGIIGLGRMGGNLALQALEKGYRVVGYDKAGATNELIAAGLKNCLSLQELRENLPANCVIFIYVIAGPIVEDILAETTKVLQPGDTVVDGGNSYWGDSLRRHQWLKAQGFNFIDCGTSGGVEGARNGACFMVGGEQEVVALFEPLFKSLAVPGGLCPCRPSGRRPLHKAGAQRD
ncbi:MULTISPECIES: NAD(P)-binding domain-containing protein [Pontibacter]|uniref:NAD(P)-binding domain-containing protein n=1 Tax=Pontibacter TaxID=323449 RepID=UPI00040B2592|nr:NAD(P)-binding domain-containing protein [Pontibacter actiniarum]MDX5421281.1 NAD(P)-binding domain-containing protein [Hymenobacteraceae bacterium]